MLSCLLFSDCISLSSNLKNCLGLSYIFLLNETQNTNFILKIQQELFGSYKPVFGPKKHMIVLWSVQSNPATLTHRKSSPTSTHLSVSAHHNSYFCQWNSFHYCHPFVLTRATRSCRRWHEPYQPRHEGSREKFKRFRELLWAFHMSM